MRLFRPQLVRRGDHYAIRKFSLFYLDYVYLDLKNHWYWWRRGTKFFEHCLTTEPCLALLVYDDWSAKETVIKRL